MSKRTLLYICAFLFLASMPAEASYHQRPALEDSSNRMEMLQFPQSASGPWSAQVGQDEGEIVGEEASQDESGLLPEVHWKIEGLDCKADRKWSKDSYMKFERTDGENEVYKSWDEYILNPEDWEAFEWSDTWDPSTRRRITSTDLWRALEYLPSDSTIYHGDTIYLGGQFFTFAGKRAWILDDEDSEESEARFAWAMTNQNEIKDDLGGGSFSRTGAKQYCAFYDDELGLLIAYIWVEKLYSGQSFVEQRVRQLSLTYPEYAGTRTIPDISLEEMCTIGSAPLDCASDYSWQVSYGVEPDNEPQAGEDVTLYARARHPENIASIRYFFGQHEELEEITACRDKQECLLTYNLWREPAKPDWRYSTRPDFVYVQIEVEDVAGNEDEWGTAIKPESWNQAPTAEVTFKPEQPEEKNDPIRFQAKVEDRDGDPFSLKWFMDGKHIPELDGKTGWAWTQCVLQGWDWKDTVELEATDSHGATTRVTLKPPPRERTIQWRASCPRISGYELSKWKLKGTKDQDVDLTFKISNYAGLDDLSIAYSIWSPDKEAWYCEGEKTVTCLNLGINPKGLYCAECGMTWTANRMLMTEGTLSLEGETDTEITATAEVKYEDAFRSKACGFGAPVGSKQDPPTCWVNGQFEVRAELYSGDTLLSYREEPIFYTSHIDNLMSRCNFEFLGEVSEKYDPVKNQNVEAGVECILSVVAEALKIGTIDKIEDVQDFVCDFIPSVWKDDKLKAFQKVVLMAADVADIDGIAAILLEAYDCGLEITDGLFEDSELATYETEDWDPNAYDDEVFSCGEIFNCAPSGGSDSYERFFLEEGTLAELEPDEKDMDLHFYTLDGKHVGFNYQAGEFEAQLPTVFFTGEVYGGREVILVPPGVEGFFKVDTREIERSPEGFTLSLVKTRIEAVDQDGDGLLQGEEIQFIEPRGVHVQSETSRGRTLIFTPPVIISESVYGLVGEKTMEYIDENPPEVEDVDFDRKALEAREMVRVKVTATDDRDPSPRTMIRLRGAGEEHIFYAFACENEGQVKLIDVDPTELPGGSFTTSAIAVDDSGNRSVLALGTVEISGPAVPAVPWLDILSTPGPVNALYRRDLAEPVSDLQAWPNLMQDPQGVFEGVTKLEIRGYALGLESAAATMELQVPEEADLISIPLATALNGPVEETDSEAGVVLEVLDTASGETSQTYATNIMDSTLGEPYLYAFADVSPFRGKRVQLTVTLLQPDVCAGSSCTHDIDLYIGPVIFERSPDLCTTEPGGSHWRYDYPNDPYPEQVDACSDPQQVWFIEAGAAAKQPFENYGAGQDTYTLRLNLPEEFQLSDFKLHYGPRVARLSINGQSLPAEAVHELFPVRRGTYNRVESSARYSFANNNPAAVASYFIPGENVIDVVVAADQSWEARPFSLALRVMGIATEVLEPTPQSTPAPGTTPTPSTEASQDESGGFRLPDWCCLSNMFPLTSMLALAFLVHKSGRGRDRSKAGG